MSDERRSAAPPGRPTDPYVAAGEVLRAYQLGSGVLTAWLHLVSLAGRPAALGTLLLRSDNESVAAGSKLVRKILGAAVAEAAANAGLPGGAEK